jgi:hypothetical protein
MENTKVYEKYGLKVVLNKAQVFKEDPGRGTPAMVYNERGASATWSCAINEGELDNRKTGFINHITDKQNDWLWSLSKEIDNFLGW